MNRLGLFLVLLAASVVNQAFAATPPILVNYQGVLRSSADAPLTGSYGMLFRFWDAATGGSEIMLDEHAAASGNAVTVSGGLFDVLLGGGAVSDGSGPGTYTSLDAVFHDHSEVWLEVRVEGETLTPRTRIQSAPYALSATTATTAGDSSQLAGQPASFYLDSSATPQTKLGRVVLDNAAGTGRAIDATAPDGGGYFGDSNQSGFAYAALGDYGLQGYGNAGGGFFQDLDSSGVAYLGYGHYGIQAYGDSAGGYFADNNGSGYAYVGFQDYGVRGLGTAAGGYFSDSNGTGFAYAGVGDIGIQGYGSYAGGYFDATVGSGYAYAGYGDIGVEGYGNGAGGFFRDRDSAAYGYVGYGAYKIYGTGTVSFVQNHPTQKDRVIVYAAPEGDEVAVYTRGSGRLSAGRADVALGATFALVANPDLGLTAHLTPRGLDCAPHIVSISTSRLVVGTGDPRCAEIDFDYIVYGLRIGFESLPIVQVKKEEAYLPTASTLAELEAGQPDTVASSALARFRATHERLAAAPADLSRANALAAQVNAGREQWSQDRTQREEELRAAVPEPREAGAAPLALTATHPEAAHQPSEHLPSIQGAVEIERPAGRTLVLQAAATTEIGEVVSLDPLHPGTLVRSSTAGEALIAGCTLTSSDGAADIEIATAGVALCRADAAATPINVGDLLIASPLAGHAMKHDGTIVGATVLGRAIDPLPAGTGSIRVLVSVR